MLNDYTNTNEALGSHSHGNDLLGTLSPIHSIPKKQTSLFLTRRSFIHELKGIYWAERRLQKLLPRLERSVFSNYLTLSFKVHYTQSNEHLKRIEQIFHILGEKPSGKRCSMMVNIINDSAEVIRSTKKQTQKRDMAMIRIAQRVEQYEINKYSTLIRLSTMMEEHKITSLIELTLTEEREAEETFLAIKEDTLKNELFRSHNDVNDFEAAKE